jgi:hypothetical protein
MLLHLPHNNGFIPVAATPVRESWQVGDGGEANSCNFQRQRLSLLPVLSYGGGLSLITVTQQKTVRFNQFPFTLPLEVVGPGGALSTLLIATPY